MLARRPLVIDRATPGPTDAISRRSVQQAMMTLFLISTLSDWQSAYLVAYHGCDKIEKPLTRPFSRRRRLEDEDRSRMFNTMWGRFYNERCDKPESFKVVAHFYFYSFLRPASEIDSRGDETTRVGADARSVR